MSITAIVSIASKAVAIVRYLPDLIRIGKAIFDIVKKDDEMENPSTVEVLETVKKGEASVKETFEEIQKAFAKVKPD